MRELFYCVVATSGDNVIALTVRNSGMESAGLFHKLLGVEINEDIDRTVNNIIYFDIDKFRSVLSFYENYQQHKEIEFLKICIAFLRSNPNIENLKLSFYND